MSLLGTSGPISSVVVNLPEPHTLIIGVSSTTRQWRLLGLAVTAGAAGATFTLAATGVPLTGPIALGANGVFVLPVADGGWVDSGVTKELELRTSAGALYGVARVQLTK
jgi:hypothetical protein